MSAPSSVCSLVKKFNFIFLKSIGETAMKHFKHLEQRTHIKFDNSDMHFDQVLSLFGIFMQNFVTYDFSV